MPWFPGRSYKELYSVEKALQIIEKEAGRQFDPKLAPLFVQMVREGTIRPNLEE